MKGISMKRNEEYTQGERLVGNPFVYSSYNPEDIYLLLEKFPESQSLRLRRGGSRNGELCHYWRAYRVGLKTTSGYYLFDQDTFTKEDFEK